jgi:hypothetical protein
MPPPECCASYVSPPQSLTTCCTHQDPGGFCALEVGAGTGGFTRQVRGPTKPRKDTCMRAIVSRMFIGVSRGNKGLWKHTPITKPAGAGPPGPQRRDGAGALHGHRRDAILRPGAAGRPGLPQARLPGAHGGARPLSVTHASASWLPCVVPEWGVSGVPLCGCCSGTPAVAVHVSLDCTCGHWKTLVHCLGTGVGHQ